MSTTLQKKNGQQLPSLIEDFFASDRFPGMFQDFFPDVTRNLFPKLPEANISENKKQYEIELAAPGLSRDDFKVDLQDGILSISAEKKEESAEEGKNFRRKEFSFNSFTRSFYIPENLVADKIDAKYENGVLRIKLPKKQTTPEAPVKKIKVS